MVRSAISAPTVGHMFSGQLLRSVDSPLQAVDCSGFSHSRRERAGKRENWGTEREGDECCSTWYGSYVADRWCRGESWGGGSVCELPFTHAVAIRASCVRDQLWRDPAGCHNALYHFCCNCTEDNLYDCKRTLWGEDNEERWTHPTFVFCHFSMPQIPLSSKTVGWLLCCCLHMLWTLQAFTDAQPWQKKKKKSRKHRVEEQKGVK